MFPINPELTELKVFQSDGADLALRGTETAVSPPDPDLVVPSADIQHAQYNERLDAQAGDGSLTLYNDDGQYTDAITSGDRLELWVAYRHDTLGAWGEGTLDDRPWGGGRLEWTGWVRDRTAILESAARPRLELDVEEFVFGILNARDADGGYPDDQTAGVMHDLIITHAPELRVHVPADLDAPTSTSYSGTTLFDAFASLFKRGQLGARSHGDLLICQPITAETVTPRFTLTDSDFVGPLQAPEPDASVANDVRVDGGEAHAIDTSRHGLDGWARIRAANEENDTPQERVTFTIPTRKPTLGKLAIYTNRLSQDRLTVRLHSAIPGAEDEPPSDVAQNTQAYHFIAKEGWTEFGLPENNLLPNPRVIVESDGTTGHRIGVDDEGLPLYRSYHPYNITTRGQDDTSIATYRQRQRRVVEDTVRGFTEARAIIDETLDHHAEPERLLELEADSLRAHTLRPGEVVSLDYPTVGVTGDYILTQRAAVYDDSFLETDLTLQHLASI